MEIRDHNTEVLRQLGLLWAAESSSLMGAGPPIFHIVLPGDLSKPSQLSSIDGRHKGLLWANKCCCHVLDEPCWSCALCRRCGAVYWDTCVQRPVSCVIVHIKRPCLAAVQKDGDYEGLVESVLGVEADGAACHIPAQARVTAFTWAIFVRKLTMLDIVQVCF